MRQICFIFILFIVSIGLAKCSYESRETTVHKPGIYKGAKDPLLVRQHERELIDRFKLVQADR